MGINQIIIYVMLAFMAFAGIDKVFLNNKFGYGEKFEEAFMAMGPLALAIVGIMCFAPVLGSLLTPVATPLFRLFGADPAMLAGSVLASDMGGFALAGQMTQNPQVQALSGILLGSMMGVAVIFVIPYTSTVVEKQDMPFLSKGIMAGIIPIPAGCLLGGLVSGMPIATLIPNLIPAAILAAALALLLFFVPRAVIVAFSWFSKIVSWLIGFTLICAIIEGLSGWVIIPGMAPIADQLAVVGLIAITLAGAYPLIHFLTTALKKPLSRLGALIGVNDVAVAGMLASLASAIPMYPMVKDMDERGKVVAVAFSVCAGFALGDILGYTSANAPDYIFGMIVSKLAAGVMAALIGMRVSGRKA